MAESHEPVRSPDPEPEHHGLVEDIREEIEHVVEQVPKPVRWTVRKLVVLIGASLAGLLVVLILTAVLYVANRTEWAAQELTVFLNSTLARRSNLEIAIGDIKGNPFRDLTLHRAVVRFREGDRATLLEARSIRVRYSALGFLASRGRAIVVDVDAPVIRLARGPDGKLRLPTWQASGRVSKRPATYDVRLRFHGGSAFVPEPVGAITGIELDAGVALDKVTFVQLRDLRWSHGPYKTRDVQIAAELTAGDSVHFAIQKLLSPDLALTANGGWVKGAEEKKIHVELERLRWRWLAGVTGNRSFDVPGTGRGRFDMRTSRGVWAGGGDTQLEWNGMPGTARGQFLYKDKRLTVQPLVANAPAGALDGSLGWSKAGWDVGGEARHANPAKWGAIGIPGWPEGNLNGEFRYAVETHGASSGELVATLGSSELAGWRADAARVRVAFPETGPDSFTVHMERRGGEVELAGAAEKGGWNGDWSAARFPLEEWPDGRKSGIRGVLARGAGTVEGRAGELHVTGTLEGQATDWLGAHMAQWRLDQVNGRLLPKPDLTARARLANVMFLGVHFDSSQVAFHLGDETVALESVVANAADTTITTAGRVDFSAGRWQTRLDRAEARSSQFHWVADPPIVLTGDPQGVVFDRMQAHDGPATMNVTGRWASPGGFYDWRGELRDLDLSRVGLPPDWGFSGRAEVTLAVRGRSGDPRWTLEAEASRPGWEGHFGDSLSLALAGAPHRLEVRHGSFHLDGGSLRGSGRVEATREAWPDSLTASGVVRWLATGGGWRGRVEADRFPLDRLGSISSAAGGWAGRVTGALAIGGSPGQPRLDLTAEGRPLSWRGYAVDQTQVRATYEPERLEVAKLTMTRGAIVSTVTGAMPVRLALGRAPEALEAPMAWSIEMPNGDLSVLPLFIPQLETASGGLDLRAKVAGTPRHPDLDGRIRVRDGRVRLAGREELLEGVNAEFRLDESKITLDSLTARQGERGRVAASGTIDLAGGRLQRYKFALRMSEFTAVETGLYALNFDGNFTVTDGPRMNGQVLPFVAGDVNVHRAVILFDFANQSEVQQLAASTQPLYWTYRVQVNANSNLHWQPPEGDIEFSANLSLEQTAERLLIFGEMSAIRGTYYFLSNRFVVNQANLTFDNITGVNPLIDAEATTRIVGGTPVGAPVGTVVSSNEVHDVVVRIQGRADEPVISFESRPDDWDEATILQQLTVGRFLAGDRVTLQDPLDNFFTRAINRTLSAEMSRVFRGYVNEWTLDRERGGLVGGEGELILGVGTQITPNLLVRYRQRVPGLGRPTTPTTGLANPDPFERDVEAEYRLSRFFYVTSELIQRRVLSGTAQTSTAAPDFNVNLKARWEY